MNCCGINRVTPSGIRLLLLGAQRAKLSGGGGGGDGRGTRQRENCLGKEQVKVPKDAKREIQDPCRELTTAK